MKRLLSLTGIFLIVVMAFIACGPKAGPPKAGEAEAENMLALLPIESQGAFFMDVKRAMATDFVKNAIKQDEGGNDLQEFIEGTGINPEEDIYFLALGVITAAEGKTSGAAVLNMKFDKEKVLSFMRQKAEEEEKPLEEIDYNGVNLYGVDEDEGEKMFLGFLDEANVVAGNQDAVQSIIDVVQKKKDSIMKNEELQNLLKTSNKKAMFWGAMMIPKDAMEQATSSNPMLSSLASVKSVSMFFDYANENMEIEIRAMSDDAEKNSQVADFLTGIKGLGGMMAAEKPEIGKIMNSITISSTDDHVKISAVIPEQLLKTVMEKEMPKENQEDIEE